MQHTPTPQSVAYFGIGYDYRGAAFADTYQNAVAKVERLKACVNACEPFKDPLTDIPLLKLYGEQQAKLRESCEAALAERDVTIQTLRDRVKELEAVIKNTVDEVAIKADEIERSDSAEGNGASIIVRIVDNRLLHYAYPTK